MCKTDIVIVPVSVLVKNMGEDFDVKKTKIRLGNIHWKRIILDEGHEFLTSDSDVSKRKKNSCNIGKHKMSSTYKWYVTGTPVPENMKSIRAALRFLDLEIRPFDRPTYTEDSMFQESEDFRKLSVASYKIFDPFFVSITDDDDLEKFTKLWKTKRKAGTIIPSTVIDSNIASKYVRWVNSKIESILETSLWTKLLWRNTKVGVELDKLVPGIEEETIYLEFSDIERQAYKDMEQRGENYITLQQLCAHPLVCEKFRDMLQSTTKSGNKQTLYTLEQIKDKMILTYERRVKELEEDIHSDQTTIKENIRVMQELDETLEKEKRQTEVEKKLLIDKMYKSSPFQSMENISERTKTYHSKVEDASKITIEMKKDIEEQNRKFELGITHKNDESKTIQSKLVYFKTLLPILEGNNEGQEINCTICLEDISEMIAITSCGHYFDPACIDEWTKTNPSCPTCKAPVPIDTILRAPFKKKVVENEEKTDTADIDTLMPELKAKYGTKMAYIIFFIKHKLPSIDRDGKVIIFSQFDDMLNKTWATLKDNDIMSVICKGNSSSKQANISRFQKDPEYKVILLSINHCASGTNLTQGNWIFILDPRLDMPEKVKSIENQAISRAHRQGQTKTVHVMRLIIKDSLEEDILEAVNDATKGDRIFTKKDGLVGHLSVVRERRNRRPNNRIITTIIPLTRHQEICLARQSRQAFRNADLSSSDGDYNRIAGGRNTSGDSSSSDSDGDGLSDISDGLSDLSNLSDLDDIDTINGVRLNAWDRGVDTGYY